MQKLILNHELNQYQESYEQGHTLFIEGDDTQDLYILVEGRLIVQKDRKQINAITESGDMVGEMSFLLDSCRTATVIAETDVKVLRIPKQKINEFTDEFPQLSAQIVKTLAQRLKETTQVMHSLREFSDQLPDAVIVTDTHNTILAWNHAAESLHGRAWQEMKGHKLEDVFEHPEDYKQFIEDIRSGNHIKEKILSIKHADGETRFVSTSSTILYDGHFNIEGYIFISRNVTKIKKLENEYKRIRKLMIPAAAIICLLLVALFVGLPLFTKGLKILDHKKQTFRDRIIHDTRVLSESLQPLLTDNNQQAINNHADRYFTESKPDQYGITGILMLNQSKVVTFSYCSDPKQKSQNLIDSNYSGIPFQGETESRFKILSLYRSDPDNPMGAKKTELAYALLNATGQIENWLIFQLNNKYLSQEYGISEKILQKLKFTQ